MSRDRSLREGIQVQVMEELCSWGHVPEQAGVLLDENKEQTWGLGGPFSHSCAAQASVSWMDWDSLLLCPTAMETC